MGVTYKIGDSEMIKYKPGWGNEINKVEVIRETAKSVFLQSGREAKKGLFGNYFDTWNDAWQYLKERAQLRIDILHHDLTWRGKELSEIARMVE